MPQTAGEGFQFGYRRSPDQSAPGPVRHPVVVVGAGPVGLTLALGLAARGQSVVVLDDQDRIGEGSRAICFSKRALELWDRLGAADRMLEKGVVWQVGKVFHRDEMIYRFDLLPETGHKMPAFINLQQYYAEAFLVDLIRQRSGIDVRWRNKVVAIAQGADGVRIGIDTPEGAYAIDADYCIACDGARSTLRSLIGAPFSGETFEDQFLIADVRMQAEFPTERWFWFDPPFHSGQSALLHRQPDDIWRIDLQLGPEADANAEREPARVRQRVARMIGHDGFELEWVSIYRFQCRRMARFVHGRLIFAGDAAHQVSPFGARGANSGLEDAENLAWKLDLLLRGAGGPGLLASYDSERMAAADENIAASTRSTDFIAPHTAYERRLRNAALALARQAPFARRMVNAGRLSTPSVYASSLSTPDADAWAGGPQPGATLPDAPLADAQGRRLYLSDAFRLAGCGFALLRFGPDRAPAIDGLASIDIGPGGYADVDGLCARRFAADPGASYLLRPDGYVAARFKSATPAALKQALRRACGHA